jgi:hypothetical protein
MTATLLALGIVATAAAAVAIRLWPADDPEVIEHEHDGLGAVLVDGRPRHAHVYRIGDLHTRWPG